MITKEELADLVIINLSGGMQIDSIKYDKRDFYKYIDMAVSSLINAELKSKGRAWAADGSWIKTYDDVRIEWNDNRQVCFFNLPSPIVNIEGDLGLYSISPIEDETTQYIIGVKGSFAVFSNLEAAYLGDGVYECYLEGDRVIFPNMPESKTGMYLLVSVIPDSSGLADNDPINVPGTMMDRLVDLIIALSKGQVTYRNKGINDQNADT